MKKKTNKREDVLISVLVDVLCEKYSLPDAVKSEITALSKKSYIQGSNDCHDALVKLENRRNCICGMDRQLPEVSPTITIIKKK